MLFGQLFESETLTLVSDSGGAATGTTTVPYNGLIWAIDIDYGTADNTTTVTVAAVEGAADGTDRTLFVTAASQTDGIRMPRMLTTQASAGASSTFYDNSMLPVAWRKLKATVASAGSTKTIKVRFILLGRPA